MNFLNPRHKKPFKARIRVGAKVGQDHSFGLRWPEDFYPAPNPSMNFDCVLIDRGRFDARASGYGGAPYGDGSIYVLSVNDLEMPITQREALIAKIRAEKAQQIADAEAKTNKLREELAAIV